MKETRFKDTEIGRIPEDWSTDNLGDIGELAMCRRIFQDETSPNGDIPFYKIGTFGNKADAFISKEKFEAYKSTYRYPQKGDILISAAGTIGRLVIFDGTPSYFQDSNIVWLAHNNRKVINPFLFYRFQTIKWNIENTTIARLYNNNFNNTLISFPPLSEQTRIAYALTSIDNLISSLDKLIEKKKAIKEGTMQQLLTGKKRLKGFNEPWVERRLGDIAHNICTGKRNGNEQKPTGKYPFFVRSQQVYRIDTYSFDGEAIIVPGEGGIGTIFHYITGKFDYHQRVYKISGFTNEVNGRFIYYYMKRFFGRYALQNSVKATVDSLRLSSFLNFDVIIPDNKDEQSAIAVILSSIDHEILSLEAKRDKYIKTKQGMMQQLLTGRIRLV